MTNTNDTPTTPIDELIKSSSEREEMMIRRLPRKEPATRYRCRFQRGCMGEMIPTGERRMTELWGERDVWRCTACGAEGYWLQTGTFWSFGPHPDHMPLRANIYSKTQFTCPDGSLVMNYVCQNGIAESPWIWCTHYHVHIDGKLTKCSGCPHARNGRGVVKHVD